MTYLNFVSILLSNIFYSFYFLKRIETKSPDIITNGLENLKNDFEKINFPAALNFNIFIISSLIGIATAVIAYYLVFKKINLDNLIQILMSSVFLFFINIGTTFTMLYFFRIFNIARSTLLVNFFFYPVIFIIIIILLKSNYLIKNLDNNLIKLIPSLLIISIGVLLLYQNRETDINITTQVPNLSTENNYSVGDILNENIECSEWSGSNNFKSCLVGSSSEIIEKLDNSLNNITYFNNKLYILSSSGVIYEYNYQEGVSIFFDVSDKLRIGTDGNPENLFDLVFHPQENFFLLSYADLENALTVEKYFFDNGENVSNDNSEILLKIPNVAGHYSGNLIWSDFFQDFLISVGDMQTPFKEIFNFEPIDTTSPRGKILFLNKKISNPDLISATNLYEPRNDILAFGLRNPWTIIEHNEKLFIPDVGHLQNEELNIIDLNDFEKNNNKPFLFGWPLYEGNVNHNINYPDVFYWENDSPTSVLPYINENILSPALYYDHQAPTKFRAAIIGGDIFKDKESQYYNKYVFADFLSKELFAYDYKNNSLYMIPLSDNLRGNITSVIVSPFKADNVIATTQEGTLVQIQLPKFDDN